MEPTISEALRISTNAINRFISSSNGGDGVQPRTLHKTSNEIQIWLLSLSMILLSLFFIMAVARCVVIYFQSCPY
jgi:hypothetical protein